MATDSVGCNMTALDWFFVGKEANGTDSEEKWFKVEHSMEWVVMQDHVWEVANGEKFFSVYWDRKKADVDVNPDITPRFFDHGALLPPLVRHLKATAEHVSEGITPSGMLGVMLCGNALAPAVLRICQVQSYSTSSSSQNNHLLKWTAVRFKECLKETFCRPRCQLHSARHATRNCTKPIRTRSKHLNAARALQYTAKEMQRRAPELQLDIHLTPQNPKPRHCAHSLANTRKEARRFSIISAFSRFHVKFLEARSHIIDKSSRIRCYRWCSKQPNRESSPALHDTLVIFFGNVIQFGDDLIVIVVELDEGTAQSESHCLLESNQHHSLSTHIPAAQRVTTQLLFPFDAKDSECNRNTSNSAEVIGQTRTLENRAVVFPNMFSRRQALLARGSTQGWASHGVEEQSENDKKRMAKEGFEEIVKPIQSAVRLQDQRHNLKTVGMS
ncbi:hypothetical protein BJ741DRAFT_644522 [Chytriomyces cf. hyalinus JEL632]|nr:hypothetical protein BJ741DRAFT_644522 [Chytriomyces cf. hyalinus JEL632]